MISKKMDAKTRSFEYDASYYDHYAGVGPYRREGTVWLEHFKGVACQIVKRLRPRCTLEFGCALGFLVEALRDNGVDAWGADFSDFAISQVRDDIKPFCSIRNILEIPEKQEHYDLVICIEVLEHLSPEEGNFAIANLCRLGDEVLFSSTPDANHPDPTHQNVQAAEYWIEIFRRHGYDLDPNADVSFAAPHALLFRRQGALRITFISSLSASDDEIRNIRLPVSCLAERGHLVTVASCASKPPDWIPPTFGIRYLPLPEDNASFIEALPYGCALIGCLSTTASMVSIAPLNRGQKFYMVPAESSIYSGKVDGIDSVENKSMPGQISLSSWLTDIAKSSGDDRPELSLDRYGFASYPPKPDSQGTGLSKLSIGILTMDPCHTACYCIRLRSPLSDLHKNGLIELVDIQELRDGKLTINFDAARKLNILIIQRQFPGILPYDKLIKLLGNDRPKIIFEIDDALTIVPKNHIGYMNCCAISSLIEEYIKKVDMVTVSTESLKKYFSGYNENIVVLPNSLDMQLWAIARKDRVPCNPVKILFSGTLTHSADLRIIESAIEKIIMEFGDEVQFLFWGNTSPRLQRYSQTQEMYHFLPNYEEYAERLKNAEINFAIIPLEENPFNKAKSAIKWLEYSSCGIPGIYSRIDAYKTVVENGKTGILVNNRLDDWYNAIKKFIIDRPFRQRIACNAQAALLLNHTVATNSVSWLHAYRSLFAPVSIIIPVFNKVEYTRKCIEALKKFPPFGAYEIIIIDNNSTDGTGDFLKSLKDPPVKVIANPVNFGFAKACNQGAQAAVYDHLLFLNNDTEPTGNWLRPLMAILEKDQTVAAVGSKLILPDGSIQHAGVIIADDRSTADPLLARHIYYGQPSDLPEANQLRTYQSLTAACLLLRKNAFEDVGGFDEGYWNGYEDVDLCFKLQEKQWKLVYQPESAVIHHESKSGAERFVKAGLNISRLHRKWSGKIMADVVISKDGSISKTKANRIQSYAVPLNAAPGLRCFSKGKDKNIVSIVILTFNQLKYTRECIESIRQHTSEPHEIIFVDNGSKDGTIKWLRTLVTNNLNYRLIENTKNFGFSRGCNQGIEASSGEYILLLNNDVVVTEKWLAGILECLNSAPDIGIVGPMTNNISGPQKVHEVGYSSITDLETYARDFRKQNRYRRISCRRVVGFCMLFRRRLVEDIGLLDESFGTGNFEDDDFCLRAALSGYHNLIAGDVFLHHYGSRSFIGNKIDYGSSISGNRKIFSSKWGRIDPNAAFGKRGLVLNAIEQAESLNRNGQVDSAVSILIAAIRQAPEEKELSFRLAEMLIEDKRFKDANDILEALPSGADPRKFALSGICAEGLGQIQRAHEHAESALLLDPSNVQALNLKGTLAHRKGDEEAADRFFRKAMQVDPGFGETYTNLGALQWYSGEHTEAIDRFERGFILSPTTPDVMTAYHTAIVESRSFARAEKVVKEAAAVHPNNKKIAFLIVALLIQQEKYVQAMLEIERIMVKFGMDDGLVKAALNIRERIGPIKVGKASASKPVLSLCMIAKNEEEHIAKCLLSAKPVVDEMIVVDTGSSDRTKEIAKVLGAKVFDLPWSNDFSDARNFSISKASGDWILIMDADEILSANDYAAFKKLLTKQRTPRTAYRLTTRNYTNEAGTKGWVENDGKYEDQEAGKGWFPSTKVRIFPRDSGIQFMNPVHEMVEPSLRQAGLKIMDCDVFIHHYGKLSKTKVIEKGRHYYRLGLQKIEEMKGDDNALRELAIQASEIGEYAEAIKIWQKVIDLKPEDANACMNAGYAYLKLKQYENAMEFSRKAMELSSESREAALNYSAAELIAGDAQKAFEVLERLLKISADYPPALGRMAAACIVKGHPKEGFKYLDRLEKKGFDSAGTLEEQAQEFLEIGKIEQASALMEAAQEKGMTSGNIQHLLMECRQKMAGKLKVAEKCNSSFSRPPNRAGAKALHPTV